MAEGKPPQSSQEIKAENTGSHFFTSAHTPYHRQSQEAELSGLRAFPDENHSPLCDRSFRGKRLKRRKTRAEEMAQMVK